MLVSLHKRHVLAVIRAFQIVSLTEGIVVERKLKGEEGVGIEVSLSDRDDRAIMKVINVEVHIVSTKLKCGMSLKRSVVGNAEISSP